MEHDCGEECPRIHVRDLIPTLARHTFSPRAGQWQGSNPWWFRTAWVGWKWLEFSVIDWDPATYPNEPGVTFSITVRAFGRVWSNQFKRHR